MTSADGVVLEPRPRMIVLAGGVALVGALLTPATWVQGGDHRLLITLVVGVVFLALPLWALWLLVPRRIVVHPDRVAVVRSGRLVRELAYADLTEVRPAWDGSAGVATPELFNGAVTLLGHTSDGKRRGLKVSTLSVVSIDPLVRALAPEVTRRPELITTETGRTVFAELSG